MVDARRKHAGRILGLMVAAALASAGAATPALAGDADGAARPLDPPASMAVVVGSNRGGPGQADLRFAEDDARHVAQLFGSLGRYPAAGVELLLRPTLRQVLGALDGLVARAARARRQGGEVQVLFYYSGHARASALNLGDEELPLGDLRARLLAMPATVTIVLLDACQSGAISRIKGAEPTADFSFNSVSRLDNAGVAVMASSSATELSQESESLRSSYFTHHLLVGLRGAGDADRDGRVTLAEAYRYAYNQTLTATAATAIGSQHATLETGLRGKGEIVLTYPAAASAQLELPAALAGEILVRLEPAGAVMAEMHKAAGHALRLALPPGRYVAIHRRGGRGAGDPGGSGSAGAGAGGGARRCDLALADHAVAVLDPRACVDVEPLIVAAKGGWGGGPPRERWVLHAALGAIGVRNDRYVTRLTDFGFQDSIYFGVPRFSLAAARPVRRYAGAGVELGSLDERAFRRHSATTTLSGQDERFWWASYALTAFVLAEYPLWRDHLIPYARAGGGITLGRTSYQEIDPDTHAVKSELATTDVGYLLRAAAGIAVMPWRHVGLFAEANATRAPTVGNRLGDVHDSGGLGLLLGLRGAL
jgi:hypothetical protein